MPNLTAEQRAQSTVERVTVNLNARAIAALEEVVAATGGTKTDAINRALQIYALLHRTQDQGGAIYTRESNDSELERLRVF